MNYSSLYKISVEEVLAAKNSSGLTIVKNNTFDYLGNCGCPLTLLYLKDCRKQPDQIKSDNEIYSWADNTYGCYYRMGFIGGFDNTEVLIDRHNMKDEQKAIFDLAEFNGRYLYEQLVEMGEM
jgi:hypothetical protein